MFGGDGQPFLVVAAAAARPDDRFVAVEVDLGLELVPQFVVLGSPHVSTQQLDLLNPVLTVVPIVT